ncbi:hypothetical protein H1S01_03070 [Heliobacterium chlorum]|uniref:Uncharacterized protein n=1 Tax=Heliobacterium chlorum TaxID=2698 RepID=A0ABR7SZY6_HELCL|nr:hypothetical protein [Heliobacterium chlorum]MBC9783492.1 hypothetical protein [Heliobacterium chlorum]
MNTTAIGHVMNFWNNNLGGIFSNLFAQRQSGSVARKTREGAHSPKLSEKAKRNRKKRVAAAANRLARGVADPSMRDKLVALIRSDERVRVA